MNKVAEIGRYVSTHSRLKAAGPYNPNLAHSFIVSTHSRLKAAGFAVGRKGRGLKVSTHSRLKAAGASLKSLAPSSFAAPISLSSQEKQKCEYNTAFSVIPTFAISGLLKNNPNSLTLPHFHEDYSLAIHTINVSLNTSTDGFAPWCSTLRRHLLPRW